MLNTTITVLPAAAAAEKNPRTAASLYFCWVSTARITSAAFRTNSARRQFSRRVPSMSGVSRIRSRSGCDPPMSSRQMSTSPREESRASCSLDQAWGSKPGNTAARSMRSARPRGRLATGWTVRAASGSERLIAAPTSVLVIRLFPVFVPPQIATTSSGSRSTCGRSLPNRAPCQSLSTGSGRPSSRASGRSRSTSVQSSPIRPAQAANETADRLSGGSSPTPLSRHPSRRRTSRNQTRLPFAALTSTFYTLDTGRSLRAFAWG